MSADMTPETWRRIAGVMEVTLELERPLRQVYLASIQTQEPDVADRVRTLLRSMGEIQEIREESESVDGSEESDLAATGDAERIGPYRILSVLGQGGMGTVFLAEQREESLQRNVAVKVIHNRYAVAAARQRFLAERQILAHLEHPNIARMYDAGTTPDGRPYLVIEAVDGLPLDQYCDRQELSVPARLRLLRQVCHAVSYAHGHLIVHRDLKPSNILVTQGGEPKLLDFGIAKILDHDVFGLETEDLTRTSEQPMTPSYASPEQIQGLPITTATDIFALGALLYKILTGKTPFHYPAGTPEVMAAVQSSPLAAPSQAVQEGDAPTTPAITSSVAWLKGDLDNIVLKALARESSESYRSVQELAEDLTRYLEGRPVLATRGSTFYKARKFVRRHRWPVTLAALLVASLVAGLLITGTQADEIRRQRDQVLAEKKKVEVEKERSDEVNQFLIQLFENASPSKQTSQEATVRELLERAVETIDGSFDQQPLTRARLRQVIGQIYFYAYFATEAKGLLTQSLEERRQLLPAGDDEIVGNLIALARPLTHTNEFEEAREVLTEAYSYREGSQSQEEVDVLIRLTELSIFQDNLIDAQEFASAAYEISEKAEGISLETKAQAATAWIAILFGQGKLEQALEPAIKAVAFSRELLGDEHPGTSATLNNLAAIQSNLGAVEEARPLLEEALEIDRKLFGDSIAVTGVMLNLGLNYRDLGMLDESTQMLEEVVANYARLDGPENTLIARGLFSLAGTLVEAKQYERARELAQQAVDIYEEKNGKESLLLVRPFQILALAQDGLGNRAQAIAAYDRAIGVVMALSEEERALTSRRKHLAVSWLGSAKTERRAGRLESARERFEKAAEISRQSDEEVWDRRLASVRSQALLLLGRENETTTLLGRLAEAQYKDKDFRIFCEDPELLRHCDRVAELVDSRGSEAVSAP